MKNTLRWFILLSVFAGFNLEAKAAVPTQPSEVFVSGKRLIVQKRLPDDTLAGPTPYIIKGVTWNPATTAPPSGPVPPKDEDLTFPTRQTQYGYFFDFTENLTPPRPAGYVIMNHWFRLEISSRAVQDADLIARMNANTVRTYINFGNNPTRDAAEYKRILDQFYEKGIMVIITAAASKEDFDKGRHLATVQAAKNHPAVLMWALGNEWNFNQFFGYANAQQSIAALNKAAREIRALDPSHPVSSILGDGFGSGGSDPMNNIASIVQNSPDIQVWGLNIYRGFSFGSLFSQWAAVTNKPFYLSEFGTDSFETTATSTRTFSDARVIVTGGSERRDIQSQYASGLWQEIIPNLSAFNSQKGCIGGLVHEFNDSIWKVGNFVIGMGDLVTYPTSGVGTLEQQRFRQYDPHGFRFAGGHPDGVANEEYFGVVDSTRKPKPIYDALKTIYAGLVLRDPEIRVTSPTVTSTFYVDDSVTVEWTFNSQQYVEPVPTILTLIQTDPHDYFRQYYTIVSTPTVNGANRYTWTIPSDAQGERLQFAVNLQRNFDYPSRGGVAQPYALSGTDFIIRTRPAIFSETGVLIDPSLRLCLENDPDCLHPVAP